MCVLSVCTCVCVCMCVGCGVGTNFYVGCCGSVVKVDKNMTSVCYLCPERSVQLGLGAANRTSGSGEGAALRHVLWWERGRWT